MAARTFTRRQTIQVLAGGVALAALSSLPGCGGLLGGGGGGRIRDVTGTFALPPGFSLPSAELVAETAWDSQPLGSGAFASKMLEGSRPIAAFLKHSTTDRYVLAGLVGGGTCGVSALGSAVLLIALQLGVFGLPEAASKEAIALIEAHPATASLASVIEARVSASPYALFEGDAQINAALTAALNQISQENARSYAAGSDGEEPEPNILIQPGDQSMARVIQTPTGAQVKVVNLGRRPITAYTYRIAEEDENGVRTDLPQPVLVAGPQQIAATTGLVGAIASLSPGSLYAPVEGPAMTLPVTAGSRKTFYETIVLMASADEAQIEPSFYGDPKYAAFVPGWRAEHENLNVHASLGGVLFELVGSVFGGVAGFASREAALALLAEIEAIQAGAAALMIESAALGRYGIVIQEMMELAAAGDTGPVVRWLLAEFVAGVEAASSSVAALYAQGLAIRALALLVLEALAVAGSLVALVDLGFTSKDVISSSKGQLWSETLVKPSVIISPKLTRIHPGGRVNFNVTVTGEGERTFRYVWTLTGGQGVLSEVGATNVGRTIETTTTSVDLQTTASDQGTLTVEVEAFVLTGPGAGSSFGSSTASVVIDEEAVNYIVYYETVDSPLPGENDYDTSVYVGIPLPSEETYFELKWKGDNGENWSVRFYSTDVPAAGPWTDDLIHRVDFETLNNLPGGLIFKGRRRNDHHVYFRMGEIHWRPDVQTEPNTQTEAEALLAIRLQNQQVQVRIVP